jgi:hypothetical protein
MILLILLIIGLLVCLSLLKDEKYEGFNSNIKNKNTCKYLGWKQFVRNHYSNYNVPRDNSFKNTLFENYLNNTPLKYDDIF